MTNTQKRELVEKAKADPSQGNLESIFAELIAADPDMQPDNFLEFKDTILECISFDKRQSEEQLLEKIERHAAEGRKFWREVYVAYLIKHGSITQAESAAEISLNAFNATFPIQS